MKHPLAILALVLSSGIFIASKIKIAPSFTFLPIAIFLALSVKSIGSRRAFYFFAFCLIFCLGVFLLKSSRELPKCDISKYFYYKSEEPYILRGFIDNEPLIKDNKAAFIFKAQKIQAGDFSQNCCGRILVSLKGKRRLSYGQELILRGSLYRPFKAKNSRSASYREYLYNQGISFVMNVKSYADALDLNNNKGFFLKRFALGLKQKMKEIISRSATPLTGAILEAMILGEKNNVPWFVNYAMMRTGTVHILVVSGFNVAIAGFIIMLILKVMRITRKARLCITIACLMVYCLVTGASTPVVRATIMGVVFIFSGLINREPDIYNSLGLAATSMLAVNPRQLFDIGFELSFASVIAIVYLYPALSKLLTAGFESKGWVYPKMRFVRFLIDSCLVSFSCWIATLGIIAYYFKIFSPVSVLANIFIVPIATLITLSGFSLISIGLIFSPLSPFFASTCELLVVLLLKVNAFLLSLPFAYVNLG